MIKSNGDTKSTWVDPDDAPELGEGHFLHAAVYEGDKLIRLDRTTTRKTAVKIRYDQAVITAFRATGKGWQTRMNNVLREYVRAHPPV
jgi:uncharacterized protein (DUF4415 family)